MSDLGRRFYFDELSKLLKKNVTIVTIDGKAYVGNFLGYDPESMSVCLVEATEDGKKTMHQVFLNGNIIAKIFVSEKPFDLKSLSDRLERVFPKMVRLYEDIGVIVVMDRIRVNEKGIIEGNGPVAERVQKVYNEFMKEVKKV